MIRNFSLTLLILSALMVSEGLFAQYQCSANEVRERLEQQYPSHGGPPVSEDSIAAWIAKHGHLRSGYTIPVVVHLLYNTAAENISDDLIYAQINQLNLDFSATNADAELVPDNFPVGAANIDFCLAQIDPQGNPTSGIIRKATDVQAFSASADNMKFDETGGADAWDTGKYLNIWVCNLNGWLGYAQFPQQYALSPDTDGLVLDYAVVGSVDYPNPSLGNYAYGRVATHEMGHSLGLEHIWGDDGGACSGDDQVADTPNQAGSTTGCLPELSYSCGSYDMTMNYMDYGYDLCIWAFTPGQADRMAAMLNSYPHWLSRSEQAEWLCQGEAPVLEGCHEHSNITGFPLVLYEVPAGYISGHNTLNDLAKAEYFSGFTGNDMYLDSVGFYFAAADGEGEVEFVLWEDAGGMPGAELQTETLPVSTLMEDVAAEERSWVDFSGGAPLPSSFFLGIKLSYGNPANSVALYTNEDGATVPTTAWEQWSDGSWYSFNEEDSPSWDLDVSLAVYPTVCYEDPTSSTAAAPLGDITLYPNPGSDYVECGETPKGQELQMELYDAKGCRLVSGQPGQRRIDTSALPAGVYFIRIILGDAAAVRRWVKH